MKRVFFILFFFLPAFVNTSQAQDLVALNTEAAGAPDDTIVFKKQDRPKLSIAPNPFVHSATIEFTIKKDEVVTLEVFDLAGKIIRSYAANESLKAGTHTYVFDPSKLKSGVYLCRLNCGGKVVMKKMVKSK